MSSMTTEARDETKYRQASLVLVEPIPDQPAKWRPIRPKTTRVCWLPSSGLKPKQVISLKNEEGTWAIAGVSDKELPKYLLHTDWNVGGLDARPPVRKKRR